jgi:O-antigen/teichoic acid export membrane protein
MKLPFGFSAVMIEGSITSIGGALLGLLCARTWGPELSGITSLAMTLAATFTFLSCLSIEQILIARYTSNERQDSLLVASLVLRCAGIGIAALGLAPLSLSLDVLQESWQWLPLLAFAQMSLVALDMIRLWAQALNLIHLQVRPRLVVFVAGFAAKCACLDLPITSSVWAIQLVSLAEAALYLCISVWVARTRMPWPIRTMPSWSALYDIIASVLRASLPLWGAGLLVMLFFKLDYFALSTYSDALNLGLYASAMRVTELYIGIANLALIQIYPAIARSFHDSGPKGAHYQANLQMGFRLAFMLAMGIVLTNYVVGETILKHLLGDQFAQAIASSTMFCLLSVPLLSGTIRGFAISLEGLHKMHFYCASVGCLLCIPLLIILTPPLGFRGALITDLIAYTASAMLTSWLFPPLRSIARLQWKPFASMPRQSPCV